ncbi:MAG: GSU2403 family nucleotidyltransferase fold protein [Candidatus Gastranaerophilales bacterium]|nr:GSU2403 family nucleotidyltransferase fold protein [Candidatus Gastranaerophilales bacterium]
MNPLLNNFFDIIKAINETQATDKFVIIGSWAYWVYNNYLFKNKIAAESLHTTDIDIFISRNTRFPNKIEIIPLLENHGFKWFRSLTSEIDKFEREDFKIEFLTEMKSKGVEKNFPFRAIGLNAITIRYLELLNENYIKIKINDLDITLPDPINYALHKLLIAQLRKTNPKTNINKKEKDIRQGLDIMTKVEISKVQDRYSKLPKKWKQKILKSISESERPILISLFENK